MRRGFKEEAKRLALEVRAEIGVDPLDRLNPRDLAAEYGIPVYTVTELAATRAPVGEWIAGTGLSVFSAALVPVDTGMLIIDNDLHSSARRASSIAHEMAHVLCEHRFTEALITAEGCRAASREDEAQADWLGGELLITYTAAVAAARNGWEDQQVADAYGVSAARAAMRMNASGARLLVQRQRAARARAGRR